MYNQPEMLYFSQLELEESQKSADELADPDQKDEGKSEQEDEFALNIPYTVKSMSKDQIHLVADYPNLHTLSKEGKAELTVTIINNAFLVSTEGERMSLKSLNSTKLPE